MADRAAAEYREVGRAGADVDQARRRAPSRRRSAPRGRGELLEHDVVDRQPAALHALHDVLRGALGAGDDVHLASRRTPDMPTGSRMPSCVSTMNSCGSSCRITRWSAGIATARAASSTRSRSPALTSLSRIARCRASSASALAAGDARTPSGSGSRPSLGFLDRALDRVHGRLDVDDDAALQSMRRMRADPDDLELVPGACSPTIATIFDVPMSSPTTSLRSSRLPMSRILPIHALAPATVRHRFGRCERGIRRGAPADREAVRVTQIHIAHSRQLRRERGRDHVEEAQQPLVDVAAAEPNLLTAAEQEAPCAALVLAEPLELEIGLREPAANREIAARDVLLGAGRARELGSSGTRAARAR